MRSWPDRLETGMTLIEVMVVVFIIGLASGLVVLTIPERKSAVMSAAEALAQEIADMRDRALLTGSVHAIDLTGESYTGLVWREERWVPLAAKRQVETRALRFGVEREAAQDVPARPDLIFDPTGVGSPATLIVEGGRERIALVVGADGGVVLDPQ